MTNKLNDLPERLLMGPGPSNVAPEVLEAMGHPLLGHLDPLFLDIMNDMQDQLRTLYGTKNKTTLAMSGTGSAGMETLFVNLVEPGDTVVIGVNGLFGQRMVDVAERCGAVVVQVKAPWGEAIPLEKLQKAMAAQQKVSVLAIVHAETSTGVRQPLEGLSDLARQYDALLFTDTVTSLGGIPVEIDKLGIDAAYSGTQKCLSAPPGLSPVTLGERALVKMSKRRGKVQSWYLDLSMIQNYWGEDRFYHHTAPISMVFSLYRAASLILEEGLSATWDRHAKYGKALQDGLEAMGLKMLVDADCRLPQLTSVCVPEGVDEAAVRRHLLTKFNLEIGGGLGDLKGKIWRIGLMGVNAQESTIRQALEALEDALKVQQYPLAKGAAGKAVDYALKLV